MMVSLPDPDEHFLRFLSVAKQNQVLMPDVFSKDSEVDSVAAEGIATSTLPMRSVWRRTE